MQIVLSSIGRMARGRIKTVLFLNVIFVVIDSTFFINVFFRTHRCLFQTYTKNNLNCRIFYGEPHDTALTLSIVHINPLIAIAIPISSLIQIRDGYIKAKMN
jgi:hypothetical protein